MQRFSSCCISYQGLQVLRCLGRLHRSFYAGHGPRSILLAASSSHFGLRSEFTDLRPGFKIVPASHCKVKVKEGRSRFLRRETCATPEAAGNLKTSLSSTEPRRFFTSQGQKVRNFNLLDLGATSDLPPLE